MLVARVGFSQSSYTTVEEAGSAVLQVISDGNNPDTVMISYSVIEGNVQGIVHAKQALTIILYIDTSKCTRKKLPISIIPIINYDLTNSSS